MALVVGPLKNATLCNFPFEAKKKIPPPIREDTHKKSVFLGVGPPRFYPFFFF